MHISLEVRGWDMFQKLIVESFETGIVQGLLKGATMSSYTLRKPDSHALIINFLKGILAQTSTTRFSFSCSATMDIYKHSFQAYLYLLVQDEDIMLRHCD